MPTTDPVFDLAAYLARIGMTYPVAPDLETLRALHLAHVTHIPFENLDIHMGRPIRLDPASLQAKLVAQRRGGYCFEQNSLFQHALSTIGYDVDACEARVRSDAAGAVRARTHMVLLVRLDGDDWLCDVGFGADGLLHPLLVDGEEHLQFGRHFRVVVEGSALVLQARVAHDWVDQYIFEPEPVYPVDFEVGNWYTSTFPQSSFVKTVTAQRALPGARHVLRQLTYTVTRGNDVETREVDRADVPRLLREVFDIDVPDGARLKGLDG